jgi:hypothetical protein
VGPERLLGKSVHSIETQISFLLPGNRSPGYAVISACLKRIYRVFNYIGLQPTLELCIMDETMSSTLSLCDLPRKRYGVIKLQSTDGIPKLRCQGGRIRAFGVCVGVMVVCVNRCRAPKSYFF